MSAYDHATQQRVEQLLLKMGPTAGDVAARLQGENMLGRPGMPDQQPVALYLSRKMRKRVTSDHEGVFVTRLGTVLAYATYPEPVAAFVRMYEQGLYPTLCLSATPAFDTPWHKVLSANDCGTIYGLWWLRCTGGEGLVLPVMKARRYMSLAAIDAGHESGAWMCYPGKAALIPLHELGVIGGPAIDAASALWPGLVSDLAQGLITMMNTSATCRRYLSLQDEGNLWPDNAVLVFTGRKEGLLHQVLLANRRLAWVTESSMRVVIAMRKQPVPLLLDMLEEVRPDADPDHPF